MSTNITHKHNKHRRAPEGRRHWPVLTVDYQSIDEDAGYGDAHFMDIGQSTWNKEDYSAKLWRWAEKGKCWSPQGEELPLSRVLDLAILVVAAINDETSILGEYFQNENRSQGLKNYMKDNMHVLKPKLDGLKKILNTQAN